MQNAINTGILNAIYRNCSRQDFLQKPNLKSDVPGQILHPLDLLGLVGSTVQWDILILLFDARKTGVMNSGWSSNVEIEVLSNFVENHNSCLLPLCSLILIIE